MARFERIAKDQSGNEVFRVTWDEGKLMEIYPEVHQAIVDDASCCGALVRESNGEESLIVDRDRWIEPGSQRPNTNAEGSHPPN